MTRAALFVMLLAAASGVAARPAPLPADARTAAPAMPRLEEWVASTGGRVELFRTYAGYECVLIHTHRGVPAMERRIEGRHPTNLDAAAHAALAVYGRP